MNNKHLILFLEECGINVPSKHQKYITAHPQDDQFPVIISDDGGYYYFSCEVPVCQNGDLIQLNIYYDTCDLDNCLVVKMSLNPFTFRWLITTYHKDFGENELLVYEFLSVAF